MNTDHSASVGQPDVPNVPDDLVGLEDLVVAGRVPSPEPQTIAAARSVLAAAIERDTARPPGRWRRGSQQAAAPTPGWRRTRRYLGAAAVAATALAAVNLLPLGPGAEGPGENGAARPATFAFFTSVAHAAEQQPASDARAWKITVQERSNDPERPTRTETTILTPRRLIRPGEGSKPGPTGGKLFWDVGDDRVDWNQLQGLPTDPERLRELLAEGAHGKEQGAQVVDQAGQLLSFSPAGPRLRAALYRVMAETPGVELTEKVTDARGRVGTGVTWPFQNTTGIGIRTQAHWIIDPDTGALLETRRVALEAYDARGCVPSKGVDDECSPSHAKGDTLDTRTYLHNGPTAPPR